MNLATGANVSSKSTPYFCRIPLATSRALYRSMSPSAVSLTLKTHLLLIAFRLLGKDTSSYVLFLISDSNSDSHASFHLLASLNSIADLNDVGTSSTESTTYAQFNSSSLIDVSKADMSLSDPSGLCDGLVGVPFVKLTRPWRFELGGRHKLSSDCVLR